MSEYFKEISSLSRDEIRYRERKGGGKEGKEQNQFLHEFFHDRRRDDFIVNETRKQGRVGWSPHRLAIKISRRCHSLNQSNSYLL